VFINYNMYYSRSARRFSKTRTKSRGDRRGLRELASELAEIADQVSAIADWRDLVPDRGAFSAAQVQDLLDARHRRAAAVGLDLIQPGWTLLLVLYRAHLDGRPVRMARLATDAHVAMTTMMRWVELFISCGFAERRPDPAHARAVLLALSAEGAERVRRQLIAEKW